MFPALSTKQQILIPVPLGRVYTKKVPQVPVNQCLVIPDLTCLHFSLIFVRIIKIVLLVFEKNYKHNPLVHFEAENNGFWTASKSMRGLGQEPASTPPATGDKIITQVLI